MGAGRFEGDRKAAWTALLHAHARMVTRLAADLDDANLISLGSYDVLVQLSENGGRLRLKELVNRVVLSQPGLSRKVAKMEAEGLVERLDDPADGRGVIVHITRTGRAALRRGLGRAHRRDRAGVHLTDQRPGGGRARRRVRPARGGRARDDEDGDDRQ